MKSIYFFLLTFLFIFRGFTLYAQNNVRNSQSPPTPASATTFTCGSTVTDIDNNTYNTLLLGTQCWLKENLKVTKNPAGTSITRTCYDNNTSNCDTYGGLYNWATIMNGASSSAANPSGVQGICPNGWHIPSFAEMQQLSTYANTQTSWLCNSTPDYFGKALASTTNWTTTLEQCMVGNNPASNNASGFNGMPGGQWFSTTAAFLGLNSRTYWWTATETSTDWTRSKWLSNANTIFGDGLNKKTDALAVRCILSPPCANPTSGGTIGTDQNICQGSTPAQISNSFLPSGNNGTLEYKWQKSTTSNSAGFADISSSNSASYQPGALTVSAWFKRLARVDCSADWTGAVASNVVMITVEATPVSGSLAKTPNQAAVCEGADVSAALTAGSGGNGTDMIQYRTKSGGNWSSWASYTGGSNISTTGKTDVEIKTWRTAAYCTASTPNTVSWSVSPLSVGGAVSGGLLVCYGSNNTQITLSGQTGTVQRWEKSTDSVSWNTVPGATSTTYTAVDLTIPTWYRAVVKSGACGEENSVSTHFTIFANYKISGIAKYNNNPVTSLNGLKIVLNRKYSGGSWTTADSVITNNSGYYEFTGLTNAQYSLVLKSAHPSGQWQTWGGVNNTDASAVLAHINNTIPLTVNPPVVRVSANVKTSIPSVINNDDYVAIRQAAKSGWGFFDIPKWVFSGMDVSTRIDTFSLACGNVIRDIRGLCAGDVNGSYVPASGYKIDAGTCHGMSIQLLHDGNLPVADEMVFPVRMGAVETHGRASLPKQVGAITLFLDYNPAQIEITNVTMPENSGEEPAFDTRNGVLYIGWVSPDPIQIAENQSFILIHARLTESLRFMRDVETHGRASLQDPVRFTLNDNPLSELADESGNVIDGARLTMPVATPVGTFYGMSPSGKTEVVGVYPNPAKYLVNVEIMAETEGIVKVVFCDLTGRTVSTEQVFNLISGLNQLKIGTSNFPAGVYMLKISDGIGSEVRKVVVNN